MAQSRGNVRSMLEDGAGGRRRGFFGVVGNVASELSRVTWPTREEALRLTGLVLAVAAAAAVFLGLWDFGFGQAVDRLLLS